MWGLSIAMCFLHRIIEDINYAVQDFLITFFEFLAVLIVVIGATKIFPKDPYSNKRVWFYYIICGGCLSLLEISIKLVEEVYKIFASI